MRILTVAEALLEVILEEELLVQTGCLAHVGSDHHVVLCCVSVCLCRKLETGFLGCVAVLLNLGDDLRVIVRVAHHCHRAPVLGCGAEH